MGSCLAAIDNLKITKTLLSEASFFPCRSGLAFFDKTVLFFGINVTVDMFCLNCKV